MKDNKLLTTLILSTVTLFSFGINEVESSEPATYTKNTNIGPSDPTQEHFDTEGNGGAMLYDSGTHSVTSATFNQNNATGQGGAIYNSTTLTISGSQFTNNTSTGHGGAIYNSGNATISGSTFSGNSVTGESSLGADIYNSGTVNFNGINSMTEFYNAGTATNTGTFSGNIINNGTSFSNNGSGTITGNVENKAGSFTTAAGAVTGSIKNDATLNIGAGTNTAQITRTENANGNTTFTGNVTNQASVNQNTVTINSGITLTNEASITAGTKIDNRGTLSSNADNINAVVQNYNSSAKYNVSGGAISNTITNGILTLTGNTTVNNASYINGVNTLDIGSYTLTVLEGAITKLTSGTAGKILIDGIDVSLNGAVKNALEINNGAVLSSTGANLDSVVGNVTNNGELSISSGTLSKGVDGGTLTFAGSTTNSSTSSVNTLKTTGALTNSGVLEVKNTITNNGSISGNGELKISGSNVTSSNSISQGTLTVTDGKKITNNGSITVTTTLSNSGTIANNSTLNLNGSNMTNSGVISGANGVLNVGGKLDTTGHSITQKTISVSSGTNNGLVANVTDLSLGTGEGQGLVNNGNATILKGGIGDESTRIASSTKITGTGITEIQGLVTNNADIQQNALKITGDLKNTAGKKIDAAITNTGVLEANASDIKGNITNTNGTYNITGGAIATNITNGIVNVTGNTSITDVSKLMSASTINNKAILDVQGIDGAITKIINNIDGASNGTVKISGSNISIGNAIHNLVTITGDATIANVDNFKNTVTNNGTLTVTDSSILSQNITTTMGSPVLNISSGKTLTNNASITQTKIELLGSTSRLVNTAEDSQITANVVNAGIVESTAGKISGNITNEKTLTLNGGSDNVLTSSNVINQTGSNGETTFTGKVNNTGNITQKTVINNGTLTNSGIITAAITNNGSLTSNASKIRGAVTNGNGHSLTLQNDTFDENGSVSGAGNVILENVTLTGSQISGVTGNVTVSSGKNAVISGELSKNILGDGAVKVGASNLTVNDGISLSNVDLNGKTLNIAKAATVSGNLNLNNGILNMKQGTSDTPLYSTLNVGTLKGTGQFQIDLDMTLNNEKFDKISANAIDNAVLNLTNINIRGNRNANGVKVINLVNGATGVTYQFNGEDEYTASSFDSITKSTYKYVLTKDASTGGVQINSYQTQSGISDFFSGNQANSLSLNEDVEVEENIAALNGAKHDLTLNVNNGVTLTGNNAQGINITDSTYSLNIKGEQTATPANTGSSTITGFTKAIVNNGTLAVSDMTFTGNTTSDIENNTANLTLTGNNAFGKGITGANGTTNINSGVTTINAGASVTQNAIKVANGAKLDVQTSSTNISSAIQNGGTIDLGVSGTITKNITNSTTNGTLNINSNTNIGTVDDEQEVQIVQGLINVDEGVEVTNYGHIEGKLMNSGTIKNYSADTIKITALGSTNTEDGEIIDDGNDSHLWIAGTGNLTNAGVIEQQQLTVDEATVTNGGKLINNNSVTVTDTLTNNGTLTNNSELKLQGATMTNNGTIDGTAVTTVTGTLDSSTGSMKKVLITTLGTNKGEVTIKAGNVKDTIENNVANGLILISGDNEAESTLSNAVSGTGSTKINAVGTVYNTTAITQAVNVAAGTFNNTSGYVTGTLSISNGASAINSSTAAPTDGTTLSTVDNSGTFSFSNGSIANITNKASGTQGVTQTGGTVATVTNGNSTAAGKYTISNGTISTSITNNHNNSVLNIQGTSTDGIALVTNTKGSVNQTGGKVVNATNAGTYEISGGEITTNITNTKSLTVSENADIEQITNKASGSNGVVQTGGDVEVVLNGDNTAAGKYTISGGKISTSITNNHNNSVLNIQGTSTDGIALVTNTKGSVNQTGGKVVNATNAGTYEISDGSITTEIQNTKDLTISGSANVAKVTNTASGTNGVTQTGGTVTTVDNGTTGEGAAEGKYSISGGGVTTLNNNNGSVVQTGGTVTNAINKAVYNLQTGANNSITNYTQETEGAETNITNGSMLVVGSGSSITTGTINIGASSTNTGSLKINAGAHSAEVITQGASEFDIEGGSFTTQGETNIAEAAKVIVANSKTLNHESGEITLNSNDEWSGIINVSDDGVLKLKGVTQEGKLLQNTTGGIIETVSQTLGTDTTITKGEFKTVSGTTTFTGGTLTSGDGNAKVTIGSNTIFDITGGTVTLNGGTTTNHTQVDWKGEVKLENGGTLILDNIYDVSRVESGSNKTAAGKLNAVGGNLTINADNVLLGNQDVIGDDVNLALYKDITVAGTPGSNGANVTISSADNWNTGDITQIGGTLTLDGITTADTRNVISSGGLLNILNTVTLADDNDEIKTGTTLKVETGNTLAIQNTSNDGVTVDNSDTWTGNINQTGGILTLSGRNDETNANQTYNLSGAGLLKLDNSKLTLAKADNVSKTTEGSIEINNGSALTYQNGIENDAVITSNNNSNNKLNIGTTTSSDAITTLTLDTNSSINANTITKVNESGKLNSYGAMIEGAVVNNGEYNLRNEGDTAGNILQAITGTGTLNLIGDTQSTGANGTIEQAVINIMHETTPAQGIFTAGASVTAHTTDNTGELNIKSAEDKIVNAVASNLITADILNNDGTITGDSVNNTYGNLKVNNGGYSKNGEIEQGVITFVDGNFDNDTTLTAHEKLINSANIDNSSTITAEVLTNTGVISDEDETGSLIVNNGGSSSGEGASITQDKIEFKDGIFTNSADMTAITSLKNDKDDAEGTNSTLINNNNAVITAPEIINDGTIRNVGTGSESANKSQIKGVDDSSLFTNNGIIENTGDIVLTLKNTNGARVENSGYGTLAKVSTNEEGGTIISTASGLTDTVTNDGDVYLNNGNGSQGNLTIAIDSTNTTNKGNLYITDDVAVTTSEDGLSTGSILQKYIEVQSGSTLTNKKDGNIEAASMYVDKGKLRLEEGSITYVPDILIDEGTLILVDDAELKTGSNVLINNGELQLEADKKNVEFRAPVDENSIYSISAKSNPGLKVTIDSDISKALSVTTKENSTLDLDSVTIKTLGDKTVSMENGSTLGLNSHNTHDGTFPDVTFVSNIENVDGGSYSVNINNDGASSRVTLQTEISGAKEINVINGTLVINDLTQDEDGNPIKKSNINSADVNLKADEENSYDGDMNIIAQNTIDLTSNIKGDDVEKNNLYIDDYTEETANGVVKVYSKIDNVAVHVNSGELWLTSPSNITNKSTVEVLPDAILNVINNSTDKYGKNYTLEDGAHIKFDADTVGFNTDNFSGAKKKGSVVIDDINPMNAEKIVHDNSIIDLRHTLGIKNLEYSENVLNQHFLALTPIRYLQGFVDKSTDTLMFVKTGDEYENFNPAVFNSAIAAQVGGYLTQLDTYNQAFGNMDMYSMMTQEERQAAKYANKYAAADSDLIFSPLSNPNQHTSAWFRPYTTFEHVKMKRGPKVKNISYGTFAGLESGLFDLGHGWDANFGAYVGYNGSHQNYPGFSGVIQAYPGLNNGTYQKFPANSIYQNGATLGIVGMAFKNDFFVGSTINVSDNIVDATNMYGKEDFNMLMSGAAIKGGYNWDLAKGKFIIQPSFQTSYSFVNTFNYTNSAGVRINSDPLNAIQIEPQLKLIGNFKHGWQPYAHLSGVWTIMDKSKYMANDVSLPELSIKPYAKYGFGLRKTFGDRASGFFQTFFTSGGRSGMGLQFGFKIQLGDSNKKSKIKSKKNQSQDELKSNNQKKYITQKA